MSQIELTSIPDLFFKTSEKYSQRPALQFKQDGHWKCISFDEFRQKVITLGASLGQIGVGPSDKVAILSSNRPEWLISDLAILSARAITVPLYATLQTPQIMHILMESEARAIILEDKSQFEKIIGNLQEAPSLKKLIVIDPLGIDLSEAVISMNELLDNDARRFDALRQQIFQQITEIKLDDLASIVYTSGTTGSPKGVMLSHGNFLSNARSILQVFDASSEDVVLSFLPLSHVLERTAGYYSCNIASGALYTFAESIEKIGDNLVEISPTIMVAVPRLFEKIYSKVLSSVQSSPFIRKRIFSWALSIGNAYQRELKKGKVRYFTEQQQKLAQFLVFRKIQQKTGGRFRYLVSGGAPLEPKIAEFFFAMNIPILEGFGLTETSPVTHVNTPTSFKIGAVGRLIPEVQARIAEDGEVLIKGPNVMKGYYKKPEATAEAFTSDGWFKTGDIGRIDEDGFLWITDRKKEIIVTSGGKNIAPQPIENLLKSNEFVSQAMILGDRRNFVSALIVPNFEKLAKWASENGLGQLANKELIAHPDVVAFMEEAVNQQTHDLPRYEQIRKVILLDREWTIESGELTPTLKLKRQVVMDRHRDVIQRTYAD